MICLRSACRAGGDSDGKIWLKLGLRWLLVFNAVAAKERSFQRALCIFLREDTDHPDYMNALKLLHSKAERHCAIPRCGEELQ